MTEYAAQAMAALVIQRSPGTRVRLSKASKSPRKTMTSTPSRETPMPVAFNQPSGSRYIKVAAVAIMMGALA
jgi:hypothetical protein